jgi:predicted transposase YbfD/YdcC
MSNIQKSVLHGNANFTRIKNIVRTIPDPRTRPSRHPFESIIIIALCAQIGGANDAVGIAQFGLYHSDWFKRFLHLPFGIPSHDTFNRILGKIDARDMCNLLAIVKNEHFDINQTTEAEQNTEKKDIKIEDVLKKQISIDGKVLRALSNGLVLVKAFFAQTWCTLTQRKVQTGTNEITTIPLVLHAIKGLIRGALITIDAIGTQVKIANMIIAFGGDYLLAVKGNQKQLHEDIELYLLDISNNKLPGARYTYHETLEKGHGRTECRKCWTTTNVGWLYRKKRWKKLASISLIETTVTKKTKNNNIKATSTTRRYYISSLLTEAKLVLAVARNHWAIENKLHWSLNVSFREHVSTIRKRWGPENMAILRATALQLIQNNRAKMSINNKRARAACNFDYLLEILLGEKADLRTRLQKIQHHIRRSINACRYAYHYGFS